VPPPAENRTGRKKPDGGNCRGGKSFPLADDEEDVMSIGAVGGFDPTSFAVSSAMTRKTNAGAQSAAASNPLGSSSPEDAFLNYMKETPGQRMIDSWLQEHHLTQDQLNKMDPKERDKIMKQMQTDIAQQLKNQTEDKAQVDIMA
jgi:hypothetical protein